MMYIQVGIKALQFFFKFNRAKDAGITIMNEVGVDPGIDHMLAMECFDEIHRNGGKVGSFFRMREFT